MPRPTKYELVDKIYKYAVAELVVAVVGRNVPRAPYSAPIKEAAWNLVEAFQAGQAVDKEDHWLVEKNLDDAITGLVGAIVSQDVPCGPYSGHVYEAARNLVEGYQAGQAVQNCRITDLDEYEAERERLRQIGLTIDPAIAETMFWYADEGDPYDILDEEYHENCYGRVRAARNPGRKWVVFHDLPEATYEALWKRDGRKLVFPYGVASTTTS
jgi:hypothetical protein